MTRTIKTTFNAGEFSPRLYGRVDLKKYAGGNVTMLNYLPMPHGAAARRPGFKFISETKTHSKMCRLIPFQFSTEQAYIIEAGDQYMRFYMNGGQIQGVDSNTKALLHFEGIEASQTFIDDGTDNLTVTANNDAQIDTSQSVFSGSSGVFSKYGDDDYISLADSASWDYGASEFTIDFRVRFNVSTGMHCLYYQPDTTGTDYIALFYDFGTKRFYLRAVDGGTIVVRETIGSDVQTALETGRFYHIALIRGWGGDSDDWALVLNGAFAFLFTDSSTMPNHDQPIQIGGGVANPEIIDFGNNSFNFTVGGNTTISTAQKKFGRGSVYFDGTGDYLGVTNANVDLFNQTNFTIELFVRHTDHYSYESYISGGTDSLNYWYLEHVGGYGIQFAAIVGGYFSLRMFYAGEITDSNWHHIVVAKVGNNYGVYKDGTQVLYSSYSTTPSYTGNVDIARRVYWNDEYFDGHMQNVRISYTNVYGLSPNSGLTDTYNVPTTSPVPDVSAKLLIYGQPKNLDGWLDEYRISKGVARWTSTFSPPTVPYPAGDDTGTTYEIVAPFYETELPSLKWAQSADVIYITSPDGIPQKLTRTSHTSWTISSLTFDDEHWPPFLDKNITDTTIDASAVTGSITLTASEALFNSDMVGGWFALKNGYVTVTGFTSTTEVNATVVVDLDDHDATADWYESAWSNYRGWPTSVTFYEDRLCFAGPDGSPDRIDLSVTRDYENFYRAELDGGTAAADDAMVIYLSSRQINAVKWMAGTRKLLVGTSGGEWWIDGGGAEEALDATSSPRRKMDTEHGSADMNCALIGSRVLFLQRLARTMREFYYDWQNDQYKTNDLILLSEHLTNRSTITELAWQQSPHQILWCKRSDGVLLALTYMQEQEVIGWSRHTVAGTSAEAESIAVVEGPTEDELYIVVRRTINGSVKRYIERMEPGVVVNTGEGGAADWELIDSFFVDSGLTYRGAETTTISGLDHLEGETVVALADGLVETGLVVSGGSITLSKAASVIHAGLNFNSDLQPLWPITQDEEGLMVGYPHRITNAVLMVYRSLGGKIGPDTTLLSDIIYPAGVGVGADERVTRDGGRRITRGGDVRIIRGTGSSAPDYYTGLTLDMSVRGGLHSYPTVYIRQNEPLPLTLTACILELE